LFSLHCCRGCEDKVVTETWSDDLHSDREFINESCWNRRCWVTSHIEQPSKTPPKYRVNLLSSDVLRTKAVKIKWGY
jgi:hypothetical protein